MRAGVLRAHLAMALRFHLPFSLAVCCCLLAGWFELTRARAGHTIAWVYAFEWPLFAVLLAVMWWRVVTERTNKRPGPPGSAGSGAEIPADDPGLQAWRDYLAEVAHDATAEEEAPGGG